MKLLKSFQRAFELESFLKSFHNKFIITKKFSSQTSNPVTKFGKFKGSVDIPEGTKQG
jgi:hypothetical protein